MLVRKRFRLSSKLKRGGRPITIKDARRIELRHLRYFLAVAEELSFTKAADRLHTSQPSLSQQIRDLEREIGAPLFYRTKREVKLTAVGDRLVDDARSIIDAVASAIDRARLNAGLSNDHLVLGTIPAAELGLLPNLLAAFHLENRDVDVTLRSVAPGQQLAAIRTGHLDIGFLRASSAEQAAMAASGVQCRAVARQHFVAAVPTGHPLAKAGAVDLATLAAEPLVGISRSSAPALAEFLEQAFRADGLEPRIVQEADTLVIYLSLIRMGAGLGLLPDYVDSVRTAGVAYVALSDPLEIDLHMIFLADNAKNVVRRFVETAERFALDQRSG